MSALDGDEAEDEWSSGAASTAAASRWRWARPTIFRRSSQLYRISTDRAESADAQLGALGRIAEDLRERAQHVEALDGEDQQPLGRRVGRRAMALRLGARRRRRRVRRAHRLRPADRQAEDGLAHEPTRVLGQRRASVGGDDLDDAPDRVDDVALDLVERDDGAALGPGPVGRRAVRDVNDDIAQRDDLLVHPRRRVLEPLQAVPAPSVELKEASNAPQRLETLFRDRSADTARRQTGLDHERLPARPRRVHDRAVLALDRRHVLVVLVRDRELSCRRVGRPGHLVLDRYGLVG